MNKSHASVQSEAFDSRGNRNDSSILHFFLLAALCGTLYFPYLSSIPFFDKGEPREALAVQDIVQRGEWLVPLKRATDVPSKPPLFHWSAAAGSLVTGERNEPIILGRKLFGEEIAFLGGAILATTTVYQDQALSARVDMTLCFFVMVSLGLFYALYRGLLTREIWYYVFLSVVGISVLAKGLVLPALTFCDITSQERRCWSSLCSTCLYTVAQV